MELTQAVGYKPDRQQLEFAGAIARQIRSLHPDHPSASMLSKYYLIGDLEAALRALKRGQEVEIH